MKVLEATDFYYPWIAGPAPFIHNLSLGLAERGHDVRIACPSPDSTHGDESGPPRLHRVRTWPVPFGYHLRSGFPLVDLARLIRTWRPDVVHVHHPFPISLSALAVARAARIPVLATNHTIPDCTLYGIRGSIAARPAKKLMSWYIRAVLSAADGVTTPTPTAARMLREIGFNGEIDAISNGVDTDLFRPSPEAPAGEPLVLYTGRLDAEKDMATFIRAIPLVLAEHSAHFRIGGEGTDKARLQSLVKTLGLESFVTFTGYVPMDELPDVYRQASVYAICSPVELQSISTLEALASGLPVAAVDAGALPELVKPHVNGYLAKSGDPRSFARAISDILSSDSRRKEMATASRRIAENHSVHEMVSKYEDTLENLSRARAPRVVYGSAHG